MLSDIVDVLSFAVTCYERSVCKCDLSHFPVLSTVLLSASYRSVATSPLLPLPSTFPLPSPPSRSPVSNLIYTTHHSYPTPTSFLQGDEYLCPLCRISITQRVVCELQAADLLGIFACPVTETVAKNYFDIIRHPMDLQTMATKSSR